eukprot:COSAG02_NODE_13235_length_1422_cov_1.061980_2_plen_61_part_00
MSELDAAKAAHADEVAKLQAQLATAAEEKELDVAMLEQDKADAEAKVAELQMQLAVAKQT